METKEKKIENSPRFFQSRKIFIWELFLFSLTMILGLFTGLRLGGFLTIENALPAVNISPPSASFPDVRLPSSSPSLSLYQLLVYFLISLLFIFFVVFVLKSKKTKKIIYKTLFILTVGLGGSLALSVWGLGSAAFLIIILLIFAWLKTKSVLVHNLLLILGMAGAGSATGLRIAPWTGVAMLIIFSAYDYLAVYKTKHMIKMAKDMAEQGAILALIIPRDFSDFKSEVKEAAPGSGRFFILGGGDIAFPLLFSVSLLPEGAINSIVVAFFAVLGFSASFWLFALQKTRRPIPALPPIALFSIIGFLITKIIW